MKSTHKGIWSKVIRDEHARRHGYDWCPVCKKDSLEHLIEEDEILAERCKHGCFLYDFKKQKKIY